MLYKFWLPKLEPYSIWAEDIFAPKDIIKSNELFNWFDTVAVLVPAVKELDVNVPTLDVKPVSDAVTVTVAEVPWDNPETTNGYKYAPLIGVPGVTVPADVEKE